MEILQECSQKMRQAALMYYGSPEAFEGFGVGAGGDTSKKIDLAAEKALIKHPRETRSHDIGQDGREQKQ
jgi:hypothetical protein